MGMDILMIFGWLVVLGTDNISVHVKPSSRERKNEEKRVMIVERKNIHATPTRSYCKHSKHCKHGLLFSKLVGRPGTESYPDHRRTETIYLSVLFVCKLNTVNGEKNEGKGMKDTNLLTQLSPLLLGVVGWCNDAG